MKIQTTIFFAFSCFCLGAAEQLQILGGHSSTPFDQHWVLANAFDDGDKCFCTQGGNGVAYVEFVLAEVDQVKLLNRNYMPERMTGVAIDVCEGSMCKRCGVVPNTGLSAWATIVCTNGTPLRGNRIVLTGTAHDCLSFCEIIIEGKTVGETVAITGATAATPFDNDWTVKNGYAVEGKCYSSLDYNGWAYLDIKESQVSQVALLNRADPGFSHRMEGTVVEVCEKGGSCVPCGTMPPTPPSAWGVAACSKGPVKGNQIKLHRPNECLTFCDARVYIPDECTCTDYHWACQALTDSKFKEEFEAAKEFEKLKDQEPTCDDPFFKMRCPKSCRRCSC